MMFRKLAFLTVILPLTFAGQGLGADEKAAPAPPTKSGDEQAVRQVSNQLVKAFNAGKANEVANLFFAGADLTDDAGVVHKGQAEIKKLLSGFFEKFPGATCSLEVESVWLIGPAVAIEEGQKIVSTKEGASSFASHFTFVLMKDQGEWKIASVKETEDDSDLSPHDHLKALAWMVGDWVDESPDAVVKISCRWSDDKNFLLVDYDAKFQGKPAMKSSQRIGWDAVTKKIKSWVFDSDGGHGEGTWTHVDDHWVVKSTAALPDGHVGSATIILEPKDKDRFVSKGFDRLHGDTAKRDYEITIVRKPPEPSESTSSTSR